MERNPFITNLKTGYTILTPITRKWSPNEIQQNDEREMKMIFDRFEHENAGCGRILICSVENPEYRSAIVSAVNNTYGTGINPEAVTELFQLVKEMAVYWDSFWMNTENFDRAKATIAKAKL